MDVYENLIIFSLAIYTANIQSGYLVGIPCMALVRGNWKFSPRLSPWFLQRNRDLFEFVTPAFPMNLDIGEQYNWPQAEFDRPLLTGKNPRRIYVHINDSAPNMCATSACRPEEWLKVACWFLNMFEYCYFYGISVRAYLHSPMFRKKIRRFV